MKETLLTIHKEEKAMKLIDKIEAMTKLISKIGEKVVKITGKCSNGKFRAKYHLESGHIIPRTFKMNK